jgi:hypothetical protein
LPKDAQQNWPHRWRHELGQRRNRNPMLEAIHASGIGKQALRLASSIRLEKFVHHLIEG